jgi:hypothetical protein
MESARGGLVEKDEVIVEGNEAKSRGCFTSLSDELQEPCMSVLCARMREVLYPHFTYGQHPILGHDRSQAVHEGCASRFCPDTSAFLLLTVHTGAHFRRGIA